MAIYKRQAVWWTDFTVNGTRYRQSLETNDRRAALSLEKDLIGKAASGKLAAPGSPFVRLNLADAIDRYRDERKPRLAAKTITTEAERARTVKTKIGHLPLRKISADTVRHYISSRHNEGKMA